MTTGLSTILALFLFGVGCGSEGDGETGATIDSALVGDWWEIENKHDGHNIAPKSRLTFNSDATGRSTCSEALAQLATDNGYVDSTCNSYEVFIFDWSVPNSGMLELDYRPSLDDVDVLPYQLSYSITGGILETSHRDAIDTLIVNRYSDTAP